jgi:3-methyl-2-oxobutanoate hydroxymethyltransferase
LEKAMSHVNGLQLDTPTRKKVTIRALQRKKQKETPITMVTAYDYSGARMVDAAGADMVLVGDSLAQVMLGYEDTVSLTMDDHCRAVARGTQYAFRVGDMPFMSHQVSHQEAIRNAGRLLQEGRMEAVKLEGGIYVAETIRAISRAGVPVIGHIGLTPQTLSQLSGYRIQGRTGTDAYRLYRDALALQEAGAVAIIFELMPNLVAKFISEKLEVPTIGIGAGAGCDGQVLVYHDMLGFLHETAPRFLKRFANVESIVIDALTTYIGEVEAREFPAEEHTYRIEESEFEQFMHLVVNDGS